MKHLSTSAMSYYCDRAFNRRCIEIANDLLLNKVWLWDNMCFEPTTENMFDTVFVTSKRTNDQYLFAMDYLSTLLSAYHRTNNPRYKKKYFEIIDQFFDYYDRGAFSLTKSDDLICCAQTLMFIKSFDLIQYEEPIMTKIVDILYSYAEFCNDDSNHRDDNNHGLFTDMALLHLSVLFATIPEAANWQARAIRRVRQLFNNAFYVDGFNNEGSLCYFNHNLIQYGEIIKFCDFYKISGLETVQQAIGTSERVFQSFARKDNSYPIIGDGKELVLRQHNDVSACYPQGGICVVKTGDLYLTFKSKAVMQAHTHVDDTGITLRYQDIDLALDPGHYNYDRYHPVNRYLRTSGGHSGIFPLFVDGLSLGQYLKRRNAAGIEKFDFDGIKGLLSGGYELDGGTIKVWREIAIEPDRIEVRDSWECAVPQNMRQRFVLPKEFLAISRFTASKRLFETTVGDYKIKYEIVSASATVFTTMNFGVLSRKYEQFESTLLLDTVAENSYRGSITSIITVNSKGER